MADSKIGWNFPGNNNGRVDGINNSGIETFSNDPLASLAREIIQNSLDARNSEHLTDSIPVEVVFELATIPADEIPGYNQIADVHQRCKEYWEGNSQAKEFFDRALSVLSRKSIDVLVARDFNTMGLMGDPDERGSDWFNLIKSDGSSDKNPMADGSFGIGKNAPFACSALRMVFYRSLNLHGRSGQQGISMLVTHTNKKNEDTQGTGFYGDKSTNGPFSSNEGIFLEPPRDKPGTDVFIVGFPYAKTWEERITKAAIESFFLAIIKGHLNIKVGGTYVTKTSIAQYIERILAGDQSWSFALYHESLLSEHSQHFIEPDFEGLGQLDLYLLPDAKGAKRVAMTRRSGMLIYEKGHFRTPIRFAGVFQASGEKINAILRSMEPPEHNDWVPNRHSDPKEAEKIKKKLYEWINSKVRELSEDETADEVDMEGMSKYLPDELEELESKVGERLASTIEIKPKKVDVVLKESSPKKLETQRAAETDLGGEADQFGGEGDEGEGDGEPAGPNKGKGGLSSEGAGASSGDAGGAGSSKSDEGKNRGAVVKPINIKNVRTFTLDEKGAKYQVSFVPEWSGAGRIEVRAVGESGADTLIVTGACLAGQTQSFSVDEHGRIADLAFKENERVDLQVSLKDPERVALEVAAYAD